MIEGISEPTTAGGPMNQQQGLKITEELVQRVEVVYVLGLFLLGKHRKKVLPSAQGKYFNFDIESLVP